MKRDTRQNATAPELENVTVPVAGGYDHDQVLQFLRPRAITGVETFFGDTYARALRIGERAHLLTLAPAAGGFEAGISPQVESATLLHITRNLVGADDDLAAFRTHAARDRVLGPLVHRRPGIRLIRFADPFEGMVRAILGQQVSLAAAATTASRLAAWLGESVSWQDVQLQAFPPAHALANVAADALRSIGLTRAKTTSLQACAQAVVSGELNARQLSGRPAREVDEVLCALPGIGPWTASYIRMRVLGDTDAFPASDLGVLKALRRIVRRDIDAKKAETIAERWRPWRAYAAIHLWASLSDSAVPRT